MAAAKACPQPLGSFVNLCKLLEGKDAKFLSQLRVLNDSCVEIRMFCGQYDFSPEVPGNGFRSLVKMVSIYFERTLEVLRRPVDKKTMSALVDHRTMASSLLVVVDMTLKARNRSHGLDVVDCETDLEMVDKVLEIDEHFVKSLMGYAANFWLEPSMRKIMNKGFSTLIGVKNGPVRKVLTNQNFRNSVVANFLLNGTCSDIRRVWAPAGPKVHKLQMKIQFGNKPRHRIELFIPRQRRFVISNGTVIKIEDAPKTETISIQVQKTVRCLFLHDGQFGVSPKDTLIVHCHGGGFVTHNPESHEDYLRCWAIDLKTPILSIDYSLSPEAKYPESLQEILDVYLHLISGHDDVSKVIGFQPRNLILCGDSAGGYFSVALAMVLNEVRKLTAEKFLMPVALCIQYPLVQPIFSANSASRTLILVDSLIAVCVSFVTGAAYLAGHVQTESEPWYRNSKSRAEVLELMMSKKDDKFYNLLGSDTFEELSNVKLYVQASEFDPLLDDSVALAKKWTGNVTLDIIENINHGFLSFAFFSTEARRACDLSIKRIKEAMSHLA